MTDLPCLLLALTVWVYWFCVGALSVRLRRRTRKLAGIVPGQGVEKAMWIVWVPLVTAWMALPLVAASAAGSPWGLPALARETMPLALRWLAAGVGLLCLAGSIASWRRMGRNWRMSITPDVPTELVTTGTFAQVRHPIYALSIALMLCTLVVVPTLPVVAMAAIHVALMVTKALREERFLLQRHGAAYAQYMRHTGRFVPRLRARAGRADAAR